MAMPTPEFSGYLLDAMVRGGPFSLAANWTVSAHHSFPDFGDPTASEAIATTYTRFTVPRNGATWVMTGRVATLDDQIDSATSPSVAADDITHLLWWSGAMACFVVELNEPFTPVIGTPLKLMPGNHVFTLGGTPEGRLDDGYAATFWSHVWSGTAFSGFPSELDYAIASTTPSAAAAGTEITTGGMVRSQIDSTPEFYSREDSDRADNADEFTYVEALEDLPDVQGGDVYVGGTATRFAYWTLASGRPVLAGGQPRHRLGQMSYLVPVATDL